MMADETMRFQRQLERDRRRIEDLAARISKAKARRARTLDAHFRPAASRALKLALRIQRP